MAAQRRARERLEAERNARAGRFLTANAIGDSFRQGILDQSNTAAQAQLASLGAGVGDTFQDIRQRNAGRGLSVSSSGSDLRNRAQGFADASKQDILSSAQRRADARINDQQSFLDRAADRIRSGATLESATASFQNDVNRANEQFEKLLTQAQTGDQRNAAFKAFESDRQRAAARFNESVNQFRSDGLTATVASFGNNDDDKNNNFTGGLV